MSVQYEVETLFLTENTTNQYQPQHTRTLEAKYIDRSGPKSMIRVHLHTLVLANQTRLPRIKVNLQYTHLNTHEIWTNEAIHKKHKMHKHAINVQFLNHKLLASINLNSRVSTHSVINSRPVPSRLHVLHLRSD